MRFCPDCGTELPDAAKFCFNCGSQIGADIPEDTGAPPPSDLPAPAAPPPMERPVPQRPVPQRPVPRYPAPERPVPEHAVPEHQGPPADDDLPEIAPPLAPPPGDAVPIPTEAPSVPADEVDEPLTPPPPRPVYGAYARGETPAQGLGDEPPEFPTDPPHDLPSVPPGPPADLPLRLSLTDEPTRLLPDEPRDYEIDPTSSYTVIEERPVPPDGALIAGRNWFAGHKLLTAAAVAAVIAIVVFAILSADPTESPGPGTLTTPSVSVPPAPTQAAPTQSAQQTAPGAITSPGASGATSTATAAAGATRDGVMEFTVTNTECGNETVGDPNAGGTRASGQYCYVAATAKNTGTSGKTLRIEDQKMFLVNGAEVAGNRDAWSHLPPDDRALFSEIAPGAQAEGVIIFDIQKGATPARVVLHESQSSSGATIPVGQ